MTVLNKLGSCKIHVMSTKTALVTIKSVKLYCHKTAISEVVCSSVIKLGL